MIKICDKFYIFVFHFFFMLFLSSSLFACEVNELKLNKILELVQDRLSNNSQILNCGSGLCKHQIVFSMGSETTSVAIGVIDPESREFRETINLNLNEIGKSNDYCKALLGNPILKISILEKIPVGQVVEILNKINLFSGDLARPTEPWKALPGSYKFTVGEDRKTVYRALKKENKDADQNSDLNKVKLANLSQKNKEELKRQISECWLITNPQQYNELKLKVTLIYDNDGFVDTNSIKLVSYKNGSLVLAEKAFQAARRSILRCGQSSYEMLKNEGMSSLNITFLHSTEKLTVGESNISEASLVSIAIPIFISENTLGEEDSKLLTDVIAGDLIGSGHFRVIPEEAHISKITSFSSPVRYSDWKAINAQALITGTVSGSATGQITVKFRIYDVFAGAELGKGLRFTGSADGWRRMAHKVADVVYGRITGESGYFDSRVVFVSETGRKGARKKRLAIMDYDGANIQYLTDSTSIVLAPRFSPTSDRVLYTSYETGFPQINMLDIGSVRRKVLQNSAGTMSFAPEFSPKGNTVVFVSGPNQQVVPQVLLRNGSRYIWAVQKLLNEKQCDAGPEDGVLGRKTESAALDFVRSSNFAYRGDIFGKVFFERLMESSVGCKGFVGSPPSSKVESNIFVLNLSNGKTKQLTNSPFKDTSPSFSPDGSKIVFQSNRSGSDQLYTMSAKGGVDKRISFGSGQYLNPVWSPDGNMIAFSKKQKGRHHIGVMRFDGSDERLLTASYMDRDPRWAPNSGAIAFTREIDGSSGSSSLYRININGQNLRRLSTPDGASDADWSDLGR
jgi:TolB protein